jgi:ATP phosphoribosyltransferase regulatory subunit HisZ
MKITRAITLGAALCCVATASGTAFAQQPSAAAPSAAKYSDAEVEQFTKAVISLQSIQRDASVPAADKQAKMAGAVQQSGLPPQKFNEIATASNSDPALMQRIQLAAGKIQGGVRKP